MPVSVSDMGDRSVRSALRNALRNDNRISLNEVKNIVSRAGDGKGITNKEFKDLQCLMRKSCTMSRESRTYIAKRLGKSKPARWLRPLIVFVGGANDDANAWFGLKGKTPVLDNLYKHYQNPDHDKDFFEWHHSDKIVKKLDKRAKQCRALGAIPCLCLVGHSYGGDTAVEVCEELARRDKVIRVQLLVTLDPVGRTFEPAVNPRKRLPQLTAREKALKKSGKANHVRKPKNVVTWLNVYADYSKSGADNFVGRLGGAWENRTRADMNKPTKYTHAYASAMFRQVARQVSALKAMGFEVNK